MKRLAMLACLLLPACTIYLDDPGHDDPGVADAQPVDQLDAGPAPWPDAHPLPTPPDGGPPWGDAGPFFPDAGPGPYVPDAGPGPLDAPPAPFPDAGPGPYIPDAGFPDAGP